jgi:enamine deaminase RidA (YjgF/YER057c/UK114 family)
MATQTLSAQGVKCNSFSTPVGATEYFITIRTTEKKPLEKSLVELVERYKYALEENKLDEKTQQFTRIYLSDITNEIEIIRKSEIVSLLKTSALSFIEQSPLDGGPSILSYHIKSDENSFTQKTLTGGPGDSHRFSWSPGRNYSMLWSSINAKITEELNLNTLSTNDIVKGYQNPDSEKQTNGILNSMTAMLQKYDMNVRNNLLRTWIYVRDIDNNYGGMVKARRELFEKVGLTKNTRYIASTGIEGKSADHRSLVSIDGLAIKNIQEAQIVRIEALQNLSSTISYGVTFERGSRIRFGDRSHIHISGTASIDNKGNILHISDIKNQTHRTIDNIEALLAGQSATIYNMNYLIVYLRNPKHFYLIQDVLAERIPESVLLMPVVAPVCRPGWLVEIEGQGIMPDSTEFAAFI